MAHGKPRSKQHPDGGSDRRGALLVALIAGFFNLAAAVVTALLHR
jgi:hypothetical protein